MHAPAQTSPRRRLGLVVLVVCVAAGAATAALIARHDDRAGGGAARKTLPLATTLVTRVDLVSTDRYQGLLTYASRQIVHPDAAGTVTSLPHVGQILTRGSLAWSVDDEPVGVLLGSAPLFRALAVTSPVSATLAVDSARAGLLAAEAALTPTTGSHDGSPSAAQAARRAQAQVNLAEARVQLRGAEQGLQRAQTPERGRDVALIAANLSALGYLADAAAEDPSDAWSPELQSAVARWQRRLGATENGVITPSDVLVLPGPERVGSIQGDVGAPASSISLSLTSADRVATFTIQNGVPAALAVSRRVRLTAAGHSTVGRVISVTSSRAAATVVVGFDQSSPLADLTSTRVAMSVTTSDQRDVLAVPVQALVALASGGYALQLPDGRLVAVHTGSEQNETIGVSGADIHAGLRVVTVT